MLKRLTTDDFEIFLEVMDQYLPIRGLDPVQWLIHPDNIAVYDGNDNLALFETQGNGVVCGHYFFNTARGKEAYELSIKVLDYIFDKTDIKVISGLTPIDHKGAKWMNRRLGFKKIGVVETEAGPHEIYYLTREDYKR